MATFLQHVGLLVALCVIFCSVGALKIPHSLVGGNIFSDSSTWPKAPNPVNSDYPEITESITQRVDNFDPQNNATFEQRFFKTDKYYRANGPIYLTIFDIDLMGFVLLYDEMLTTSSARSEGGLIVTIETRYAILSIPTPDHSLANMRFLTVEQTLADIAHFVAHLRATTPGATATTPVIVSGYGYGGSLAVWFRQRYPHLASGVWGHAAPLQALRNNERHGQNVVNTLRRIASPECFGVIAEGSRGLEALAETGQLELLSEHMRLCEPVQADRPEHVQYLFHILASILASLPHDPADLINSCEGLLRESQMNGSIKALAHYLLIGFDETNDLPICLDLSVDMLDMLARYEGPTDTLIRRDVYLRCTQLGWFSTSSNNSFFKTQVPFSMFTDYCKDVFGDDIASNQIAQENQDRFNAEHGGITPHVTNALFTFGVNDPLLTLGVQANLSETALHYLVEDGNGVFFEIDEDEDDNEMINLKRNILNQMRSWSRT